MTQSSKPWGTPHPAVAMVAFCWLLLGPAVAVEVAPVAVELIERPGKVQVIVKGQSVAEYVYEDAEISRPYFAQVKTLSGTKVSRNYPPREGDPDDHATYHPGIWTAFGELSGADTWRNKAQVKHLRFVKPPEDTGSVFSVENQYLQDGREICREICTYTFTPTEGGWLLTAESTFSPGNSPLVFGDQEEMGFGVRVATPLMVKNGGRILNSEGAENEAGVWGKQADWADYHGKIGEESVGVTVMAHPGNFRRSWFHARDYGLLVANPFGRKAFTEGEKSEVVVQPGEEFRLRFAAYIHGGTGVSENERLENIHAVFDHFIANTP